MPPGNRKNSRRASTAKSRQQQRAAGRPRTSPDGPIGLTGITPPARDVLPDLAALDKLPAGLKAAKASAAAPAPPPVPAGPVTANAAPQKTAPDGSDDE